MQYLYNFFPAYNIRPPMYNNTCGILEPTEPPTTPTEVPTTTIDEKVVGECRAMQVLKTF